jgi:ATP-dependent Clp protease adaptor protein ClpS
VTTPTPTVHPGRTLPGRIEEPSAPTVLEPRYHLVLLDDDDHSYAYVIEMLGRVFGYEREKAYALACLVDSEGHVTVETASHEQVTRHQSRIHSYGADPRIPHCKGSMSAIVEEAP